MIEGRMLKLNTAQTIEEIDVLMIDDGFEALNPDDLRWFLGSRGLDSFNERSDDDAH